MGDILLAADQLVEKHTLNGADELVRFAAGTNVHITLEADQSPRERDSSRVQSHMLSDYKWDVSHLRPQTDRLLSVNGNFIAYRLSHDSSVEAVRVMERETRNRQLIKGFRDAIVDLAWSRNTNMLAVLDAACNLYVYHVTPACTIEKHLNLIWEDEEGKELLKGVMDMQSEEEEKENPASSRARDASRSGSSIGGQPRPRLAWCPYIPEEGVTGDNLNLLAITKGRNMHIVNVTQIKTARSKDAELDLATVREIDGAVLSVTLQHPIITVCLSPDATAVAVGDTSGQISFYVMDGSNLKFAHNWNPPIAGPLKDLIFLDNVDAREQFWRHCVVSDDEGRQIYLYECENWTCCSRLRIDSPLRLSKFIVQVDPYARYICMVDTDGSNVFCVEIDYTSPNPTFSSITQVTFYHPLVAVAPFAVRDADHHADFSFDDDDSHADKQEAILSFITITPRSVQFLDVTLEKAPLRDHSQPLLMSPRAPQNAHTDSSLNNPEILASLHAPASPAAAAHGSVSRGHSATPHAAGDVPSAASFRSVDVDAMMMRRFDDLNEKIEQLTMRLERSESERREAATNESIVSMLQAFKEEFSLREDRLLANISDMIDSVKMDTVTVVRNALNENCLAVENSIQANHKMSTEYVMKVVSERTKEALAQIVIPAVDRMCTQLFKQANEKFAEGLNQFMAQMRILQATTLASTVVSTPAPLSGHTDHKQSLMQLIKSRQTQMAFESVLNQADESSLEFVCKQIDPDELFGNGGDGGLSQPVLLSLLQQLSYRLDADTDLKFRYIEHLLEAVQPFDDAITLHVPKVVNLITDALNEFQLRTHNPNLKRQARVITQLVRNLLK